MTATHYSALEIEQSASDEQIRAAVRQQRRRWMQLQGHPKLETRQEAERRVREVSEAEAVLTDTTRRREYDLTLTPVPQPIESREWIDPVPAPAPEPSRIPVPGPEVEAGRGPTNALAIVTLFAALPIPILAIFTGHVALHQIRGQVQRGRRRALLGLTIAYIMIAVSLLIYVPMIVGFSSSAGTSDAPGASNEKQSSAVSTSAPIPSAAEAPLPVFSGTKGGTSNYPYGKYHATVQPPVCNGASLQVAFEAVGESDLRQPSEACLYVSGPEAARQRIEPTAVSLTTNEPGHYVGVLTFALSSAGDLTFEYGCSLGSYTEVPIGHYGP
ncbi:MAG: DnaJ domain-containing protein [Kineosporiaceae bacterium]|nr:DnaJ domain-containing protein [Aeromicrobium sp.]